MPKQCLAFVRVDADGYLDEDGAFKRRCRKAYGHYTGRELEIGGDYTGQSWHSHLPHVDPDEWADWAHGAGYFLPGEVADEWGATAISRKPPGLRAFGALRRALNRKEARHGQHLG